MPLVSFLRSHLILGLAINLLWATSISAERLAVHTSTIVHGLFVDSRDRLWMGATTGGAPMSPEIAAKVVRLFQGLPKPESVEEGLTPQETRFLRLKSKGHSYNTAARELGISVNTGRNYIRSTYEKQHVHSKAEAVAKAMRAGLI